MPRVALAVAASLAMGGAAFAAEGKVPAPRCEPLAHVKDELKGVTFTALTPGQFHFVEGVYAASPVTPPGPPPGDGALVFQVHGKSLILWTRGKQACMSVIITAPAPGPGQPPQGEYMPMPLTADMAKMLGAVKTGKGETADPTSDSEDYDVDSHLGHRS